MRLSDRFLANLKYDGKQRKVFDDALPNFGVRTNPSRISFIVMLGNERRMKTIGRYPKMSLKEARTEAMRVLNDLDPTNTVKSAKEVIGGFLAHCDRKNKARTVRDYTRILNIHFPVGMLPDIDRLTLLKKLDTLSATPAEQFHATAVFQTFLNWCVHNGHLNANPIAGLRNQGKLNNRDRILSGKELIAVWNALSDDRFSIIVKLMILTGQRRAEIPHITVDGNIATTHKDHTKNGKEHNFPVGTMSLQLLPSPIFNGWSKAKARLNKQSGVTNWTLHDLRRTFASNHARLGTPIHVVEKFLNHVSGSLAGVAGVYNRYSYMYEMEEACTRYEEWLSSLGLGVSQT